MHRMAWLNITLQIMWFGYMETLFFASNNATRIQSASMRYATIRATLYYGPRKQRSPENRQ